MTFKDALVKFMNYSAEQYPGDNPSPEVVAHYGRIVANHFGVEDVDDLEGSALAMTTLALGDDKPINLLHFAVVALMVGYVAGSKEDS